MSQIHPTEPEGLHFRDGSHNWIAPAGVPWGGLVITRVQRWGQPASHLEVRLSVELPVDEDGARMTAELLAVELVDGVGRVAGQVDA